MHIDFHKENDIFLIGIHDLSHNICHYNSKPVTNETDLILSFAFSVLVFGNDFIPTLHPFNGKDHLENIINAVYELNQKNISLIKDSQLNYFYLYSFFNELFKDSFSIACENFLTGKYYNYSRLKEKLALTNEMIIKSNMTEIKPVIVNSSNIFELINDMTEFYNRLIQLMRDKAREGVKISEMINYNRSWCMSNNGFHLLSVLPAITNIVGLDNSIIGTNPETIFNRLYSLVLKGTIPKLMLKLIEDDKIEPGRNCNFVDDYQKELFKLTNGFEPYKSRFRLEPMKLIQLKNNKFVPNIKNYYSEYFPPNTTSLMVVKNYLAGIQWLFDYYVLNKPYETSAWFYPYIHPPLIHDILKFLAENKNESSNIIKELIPPIGSNKMTAKESYEFITPDDYTGIGVTPKLINVADRIDGRGCKYMNKAKILF